MISDLLYVNWAWRESLGPKGDAPDEYGYTFRNVIEGMLLGWWNFDTEADYYGELNRGYAQDRR